MKDMTQYLAVFIGGGAGAAARLAVSAWATRWLGMGFPWATLTVNLLGAFCIGLLTAAIVLPHWARLLLVTGILGGFTTFSAFSLEAAALWSRGEWMHLAAYITASVIGTMAMVLCAQALVRG